MFGPKSNDANGLNLLWYMEIWIYLHLFSKNLLNLRLPSSKRRMLNAKEVQWCSLPDPEWLFHSGYWPGESYLTLSRALTVTFFPWERGSSFDIGGKLSCSSQCRKPAWGWIDFTGSWTSWISGRSRALALDILLWTVCDYQRELPLTMSNSMTK